MLFKGLAVVYFKNYEKRLNTLYKHNEQFLEAFAKHFIKRLLTSSCISVQNSDGTNDLAPAGRIVTKFYSCDFC